MAPCWLPMTAQSPSGGLATRESEHRVGGVSLHLVGCGTPKLPGTYGSASTKEAPAAIARRFRKSPWVIFDSRPSFRSRFSFLPVGQALLAAALWVERASWTGRYAWSIAILV